MDGSLVVAGIDLERGNLHFSCIPALELPLAIRLESDGRRMRLSIL